MTSSKLIVVGLVAAAAAAACGKSDSGGGAASTATADVPAGGTFGSAGIDAAACNALVPADLKDKIVFEKRDIPIKRGRGAPTVYTIAAPTNWKQGMDSFGDLKADDKGGFFSGFKVGTNCDGMCSPKDWEKIADKATFAPRLKDAKVLKDVKGTGTRLAIVEDTSSTKTTTVVAAWWRTGDDKYYTCEATLDESVKAAAPAFERACSAMTVVGDD